MVADQARQGKEKKIINKQTMMVVREKKTDF
jgi:hypothetical protein